MKRLVCGKYMLLDSIGGGSFGQIFRGEHIVTHEPVAIKMESLNSVHPNLPLESKIYKLISGCVGFPGVKHSGTDGETNTLVIDLLGHSLEHLLSDCYGHLSLKTVLMIADQMITRLQYLHNKSIIHRDIKPDNFTVGKGNNSKQIYLIDFGLAKRYRDLQSHQHVEMKDNKPFVGTARYASISAHKGLEQSRRDDMESLAYTLIYLLKGSLPWQNVSGNTMEERNNMIYEMKTTVPVEEICGDIPDEFKRFLVHVKNLQFEEEPAYNQYKAMFRNLFIQQEFIYDYKYDWEKPTSVICLDKGGDMKNTLVHQQIPKMSISNEQRKLMKQTSLSIAQVPKKLIKKNSDLNSKIMQITPAKSMVYLNNRIHRRKAS